MLITVEANVRTANAAITGLNDALVVAFDSGGVMGLCVVSIISLGLVMIYSICGWFRSRRYTLFSRFWIWCIFNCIICTGIYRKAADVGADSVGKVEQADGKVHREQVSARAL